MPGLESPLGVTSLWQGTVDSKKETQGRLGRVLWHEQGIKQMILGGGGVGITRGLEVFCGASYASD